MKILIFFILVSVYLYSDTSQITTGDKSPIVYNKSGNVSIVYQNFLEGNLTMGIRLANYNDSSVKEMYNIEKDKIDSSSAYFYYKEPLAN